MIDVAILSVIRRWHVREGVSIREISRRTKLSRNTIRKHLANGALEAVYPKRRSRSKLDGYAELLASWLKRESARGRKERRNLKQLHGELLKLGYTGSYDRVAAFARVWRRQQQEASTVSRDRFVPLVFAPGEAFQFDWSEDWVVIGVRQSRTIASESGSSPLSKASTRSNRRKPTASLGRSPTGSCKSTGSFSINSAICRSRSPTAPGCSTC